MSLLILLSLMSTPSCAATGPAASAAAKKKECVCTCVVKEDEGAFSTRTASGKNREEAGDALKKKLGKKKCEVSPACKGESCTLD